ncbi:hypothetical protein Fleli_2991 [Bernardetia litoralis DSM 6794]|uniref:Uncharacterized protein n=1 Tax=Bernardetia litoralis (strain ATCC 23117 / DSM 6794 / NBRC 15988 / NCIMB 1366 / Fx l1 / Sio-4) TaxID=880071 RepID=I4AMZ8_BERLS|nr:hypothetical protein [Bernardetia litoralis]AFM05333.1 hypothetical protein Fleli_2991 [Bernardetia litoralis DSM 6794]
MTNNNFTFLKTILLFLFFLIFSSFFSKEAKALNPSFDTKLILETQKAQPSKVEDKSNKKRVFAFKSTKVKKKVKKISFRKKLSILKLVLKNKSSKKHIHAIKSKNKIQRWNGQHTAGLLSWASVLVAVMAFFTSHFWLGILAACCAVLFLTLIFIEKGNDGTVDDVLWIFAQVINVVVILASIFE